MKKSIFWTFVILLPILTGLILASRLFQEGNQLAKPTPPVSEENTSIIALPQPRLKGEISVEEAILKRRSRREYQDKSLNLGELSQILWAGQGITDEKTGFRSAPSAGALYPLDIYLVVGEKGVKELPAGVYHFIPKEHKIERLLVGDLRQALMKASAGQSFIAQAPVVLVLTGEYERTTVKYGERGKQYVHQEAGHAAQNIFLQVESLGLGTVTIGAFDEEEIIKILTLPKTHRPLYVMPVGHPK